MNTLTYCVKQGLKNFFNNPLFSFASVATVSACIFLLCMFYILAANLNGILTQAETNVGITVFFTEGLSEEGKESIRRKAEAFGGVKEIRYIPADEAWETFRKSYFGEDAEELSAAFDHENPLQFSDSYEIFMEEIGDQPKIVSMLRQCEGVREVNFASSAVTILKKINTGVYGLSAIIIGVLLAVSVFLICNTIHVAAVFRKRENEIMKLIGAKNVMIRAPFVIEGLMIGTLGALIPLTAVRFLYSELADWMEVQLKAMTGNAAVLDVFRLIPLSELSPVLVISSCFLGIGMGLFGSLATVNRHLRSMK